MEPKQFNPNTFYQWQTIPTRAVAQAVKYGVSIMPNYSGKKLNVYSKKGVFLCAIGTAGMMDLHLYKIAEEQGFYPPGTATKRRKIYLSRMGMKRKSGPAAGYYNLKILWT